MFFINLTYHTTNSKKKKITEVSIFKNITKYRYIVQKIPE